MKKLVVLSVLLQVAMVSVAQKNKVLYIDPVQLTDVQAAQVEADNMLAFELLRGLNRQMPQENILFSPFGLNVSLAAVSNGAAGRTKDEILGVLGRSRVNTGQINNYYSFVRNSLQRKETGAKFESYNSIWADKKFEVEPLFTTFATDYFGTQVYDMEPANSVSDINRWAGEKTGGVISDVTDKAQREMSVVNTALFRGSWAVAFGSFDTFNGTFNSLSNGKQNVSFIQNINQYSYFDDVKEGVQYAELRYFEENPLRAFSVIIMLPKRAKNLDKLIEGLTFERYKEMLSLFVSARLKFVMPKFVQQQQISFKSLLEDMGMKLAFTADADFSAVSKTTGLSIDDVIQKVGMSVDEEGSYSEGLDKPFVPERSSARLFNDKYEEFILNRPFVYVVRDRNTGIILFAGKVVDF